MKSKTDKIGKKVSRGSSQQIVSKSASPSWASGLRQLYNSVLDEPLPENFKDLLSKLDKNGA